MRAIKSASFFCFAVPVVTAVIDRAAASRPPVCLLSRDRRTPAVYPEQDCTKPHAREATAGKFPRFTQAGPRASLPALMRVRPQGKVTVVWNFFPAVSVTLSRHGFHSPARGARVRHSRGGV